MCLKCESVSKPFQSGEGPSRGTFFVIAKLQSSRRFVSSSSQEYWYWYWYEVVTSAAPRWPRTWTCPRCGGWRSGGWCGWARRGRTQRSPPAGRWCREASPGHSHHHHHHHHHHGHLGDEAEELLVVTIPLDAVQRVANNLDMTIWTVPRFRIVNQINAFILLWPRSYSAEKCPCRPQPAEDQRLNPSGWQHRDQLERKIFSVQSKIWNFIYYLCAK